MQKARRFKFDALYVGRALSVCALGAGMVVFSVTASAQSPGQSGSGASGLGTLGAGVSASVPPSNPAAVDVTFGEAVAEAKRNRELALKAELEAKRRAESLSLMPSVGTAQNPFAAAQPGAMPSGSAPPDTQGLTEPLVIGLTGAMGKYTADLWHESKVYRVRSDQLPLRHRLWTVVQINEQGVTLNTKQKWTGVGRDGSFRLSAPMPGSLEPTLAAAPFGGLATASAFQANSLGQRLPSFAPPGVPAGVR